MKSFFERNNSQNIYNDESNRMDNGLNESNNTTAKYDIILNSCQFYHSYQISAGMARMAHN